MQGYIVRKKLELIEHELEEPKLDQKKINDMLMDLLESDARWRDAFRP
jgi:hypothetical protein